MTFDFCTTDEEIIDSFRNNIPVCDCSSQMIEDDPRDTYICPSCGCEVRRDDYDRTNPYIDIIKDDCATWFDFHDEEYGEIYSAYDSEVPPGRCTYCGDCNNPDYPICLSTCEVIASL